MLPMSRRPLAECAAQLGDLGLQRVRSRPGRVRPQVGEQPFGPDRVSRLEREPHQQLRRAACRGHRHRSSPSRSTATGPSTATSSIGTSVRRAPPRQPVVSACRDPLGMALSARTPARRRDDLRRRARQRRLHRPRRGLRLPGRPQAPGRRGPGLLPRFAGFGRRAWFLLLALGAALLAPVALGVGRLSDGPRDAVGRPRRRRRRRRAGPGAAALAAAACPAGPPRRGRRPGGGQPQPRTRSPPANRVLGNLDRRDRRVPAHGRVDRARARRPRHRVRRTAVRRGRRGVGRS